MFGMQSQIDAIFDHSARKYNAADVTAGNLAAWQAQLRAELSDLLGVTGRLPVGPPQMVECVSTTDRGAFTEELYNIPLDGVNVPVYVLVPKTSGPHRAVLAFHGHAPGVGYMLGKYPDETIAAERIALDANFAERLALDGYLVVAVEQRAFGERVTTLVGETLNSCRHIAFNYLAFGMTLLGERIRDAVLAINLIETRADVIPGWIGCVGHSGGGTTGLFLSALEPRVTTNVVSGYFCDYRYSIFGIEHCECNYVPGLLNVCGIEEISVLTAPRRMVFVNGQTDHIYPIAHAHSAFAEVRRAYEAIGAADAVELVVHEGGHRFWYPAAKDWLAGS